MTVTIPTFNNANVSENPTATPYKTANVSGATYNSTMGLDDVGRGAIFDSKAMQEIRDKQNDTLAMEKGTQFNDAVLNSLYDSQNGLFAKSGKAYLDSMGDTLEGLQKNRDDLLANLAPDQQAAVGKTLDNTYQNIAGKIKENALKEQETYRKATLDNLINTQTQLAVVNRNDAKSVITNIGNVNTSIAATFGNSVDAETLKGMQKDATSNMLISVLEGRIADKSLYSKDFFNMFKSQIDPTKHAQLESEINTMDSDVRSRLFADNCFKTGMSEQDAFNQAIKLDEKNGTDQYASKVSAMYGHEREMKNQAYDNQLDNFWNTYADNPDINNIPTWMKGKDRITAQNYAETYANKATKGKHDPDAYVHLCDMSITNADAFAKVNLNEYRDVLTNDEYKSFSKRQQDIQTHGYTSITPDDEAVKNVLKNVLKTYGSWNVPSKQVVSSQMQHIINEEEKRRGSQYSPQELKTAEQRVAGWLGYSKQGGTVKVLSQNAEKADFYKGLENDVMAFEKAHKHPPDQKEFQSILYQRANYSVQGHNQNVYDNIRHTAPKSHETKEVTYYADKYLPQLNKKLGTNFVVTSRYNPRDKGYNSHHNEGGVTTAIDVSMSEHSLAQKEAFYKNELNNPQVKAIGTSDKNIIKKFRGNPKLVNETSFDSTHGTNHVNHAHVTLNVPKNDLIAAQNSVHNVNYVKMKAPNGHVYNVPLGQVAEYQKIGGVKI